MTGALTPERILDAAEEVLRRFGPAKTTVVDVARTLEVSHGAVYRHFASKAALREAVAERWLLRLREPLRPVVTEDAPAVSRIRRWLWQLFTSERALAGQDPELFATYHRAVVRSDKVQSEHLEILAGMLVEIIADGVRRGELDVACPAETAWAVLSATDRFHNPVHVAEWDDPGIERRFEALWTLLRWGLDKPDRDRVGVGDGS
ncbi:TetR family transcriptional regulator [Actinopolyspora mortivallis]|uniref:TetR family transcriptional regulator n=1 Tax=Actinopolyspora mortivallis TaxID=33906 RepID=A0A2T0GYK3_ACTMO|nr:TetR family transcriptional regulator [Actinopolyspora mortivallis]PRW64181.1 TetR family transcriptional regulator [Actinopolyspora mortivallis]